MNFVTCSLPGLSLSHVVSHEPSLTVAARERTGEPRDRLLNTKEAADYLGLSPRTLEGYRSRGGGPLYVAISRNVVRYRLSDLQAWVDERAVRHTAQAWSRSLQ